MTVHLTVLPCGPAAALFEVDDTTTAAALAIHLDRGRAAGHIDVDEVVPAARTVLVQCASPQQLARVVHHARDFDGMPVATDDTAIVDIPVRYDGADLHEIAAATGLNVAEVVRRHHGAIYTAAFSGFAPGFTYLVGLDPALHLPRRSTPRARIPAGSVAIGGEFTGIYPTASPGGWHLLGSTSVVLWDLGRAEPALIPPGRRIRFVELVDR